MKPIKRMPARLNKRILLTSILLISVLALTCITVLEPTEAQAQTIGNNETQPGPGSPGFADPVANQDSGTAGPNRTKLELELTGFQKTLYNMLTGIGSIAVWMGGSLLDHTIAALVVNMAAALKSWGMDVAIKNLWEVIRDIFNLFFIFGLIWIGFKTILRINEAQTKRTLVTLIAAALLINFSLYITQVIVDFSNVLAYQINGMIVVDGSYNWDGWEINGISGKFVSMTDLNLFTDGAKEQINKMAAESTFKIIGFGFVLMVFMLISAFVFAAGAFLLLSRFIGLVLLMIFSPFMFLGWVLPGFSSMSTKWWKWFLNYAFVAPAYLFMIYLSTVAVDKMDIGSQGSFAAGYAEGSSTTGLFGFFLYYLIVTGFVYASLLVAKSMGTYGASQAVGMGQRFAKGTRSYAGSAAGAATFGLSAAALRATAGRLAQKGADNDKVKERAAQGGWRGWIGNRQLDAYEKLADSNFDGRRVGGLGKAAGIGEGQKGGFKSDRDNYVKRHQKRAKLLGEVDKDDPRMKELQGEVDRAQLRSDAAQATGTKAEQYRAKEALSEARESLEQEKHRRQIGSSKYLSEPERTRLEGELTGLNSELEQKKLDYLKMKAGDPERENIESDILQLKKNLAEAKKQLRAGGYAQALQNSVAATLSKLTDEFMPSKNKKAGEEIAEEFGKKVKQTKEDKQFGSLKDAIKDSGSKSE